MNKANPLRNVEGTTLSGKEKALTRRKLGKEKFHG